MLSCYSTYILRCQVWHLNPSLTKATNFRRFQSTHPIEHAEDHKTSKRAVRRISPLPAQFQTLDPEKLSRTDFVDLSGRGEVNLRQKLRFRYAPGRGARTLRFPENTQGFFYFHRPPQAPALASTIRFRITDSPNPSRFSFGHDLLLPNQTPWQLQMVSVLSTRAYPYFTNLLVKDGLIDRRLLRRLDRPISLRRASTVLHSLHQPFLLDFSHYHFYLWVVANDEGIHHVDFTDFRKDRRPLALNPTCTGTGMVRFELSESPRHKTQRKTVVVRVLKIIDPVKPAAGYDGYIPAPVEGQLLMRRRNVPWSMHVDERTPNRRAAMRFLVDAVRERSG
ncbi:hypothetical protein JAAARDRAFT_275339 [Jaapia argillacea MUCL 33604]|uniref:Uncharacterized protein n=1 Tax=Jaapia argillacea MUCL 33604 TaxID=933084 RepID=A0A067PSQ6_9AGAM|nr:hypothetical protein JAAARDRAFT_275339 [Jaapia argillacea MUCL 33604]